MWRSLTDETRLNATNFVKESMRSLSLPCFAMFLDVNGIMQISTDCQNQVERELINTNWFSPLQNVNFFWIRFNFGKYKNLNDPHCFHLKHIYLVWIAFPFRLHRVLEGKEFCRLEFIFEPDETQMEVEKVLVFIIERFQKFRDFL